MNDELLEMINKLVLNNEVVNLTAVNDFETLLAKTPPLGYKDRKNYVDPFIDEVYNLLSVREVADICFISEELSKKIRRKERYPMKSEWVKFGSILGVPENYIHYYMMVGGYSFNMLMRSDIILYFGLLHKLRFTDIYELLEKYCGEEEANKFIKK